MAAVSKRYIHGGQDGKGSTPELGSDRGCQCLIEADAVSEERSLTMETRISQSSAPKLCNSFARMNSRVHTTTIIREVNDQKQARIRGPLFWVIYSGDMWATILLAWERGSRSSAEQWSSRCQHQKSAICSDGFKLVETIFSRLSRSPYMNEPRWTSILHRSYTCQSHSSPI